MARPPVRLIVLAAAGLLAVLSSGPAAADGGRFPSPNRVVFSPSDPDLVIARATYGILIPIPLAFDLGTGLDGFYVALPYSFNNGEHNRVNGQTLTLGGRQWRAVSWHYPDGKEFKPGIDTIESHIIHCRGFFLARGAVNARF